MSASNSMSTAQQPTPNAAKLCVERSSMGPRLYLGDGQPGSGDLRPGSHVVWTIDGSIGSMITVTFENGAAPLVGCGSSFRLGVGAPVTCVIAAEADGSYAFRIEDDTGRAVEGCRLVVATDGVLDKTGFAIRESGRDLTAALLCYERAASGQTILPLIVRGDGEQAEIAVRDPQGAFLAVADPSPTLEVDLPLSCVGCVAVVNVTGTDPTALGVIQTGGTEEVDVVVEPPL